MQRTELQSLSTTEIVKRIREELKELKGCKFSLTRQHYSGGSSISLTLMESDFRVIKKFEDIPKLAIFDLGRRRGNYETEDKLRDQIKQTQEANHHQLSEHTFREEYNENNWINGVFLTKEGHELFSKVMGIVDKYNYNNSDSSIDYFDVHFYLHLNIGKWDKDYQLREDKKDGNKS